MSFRKIILPALLLSSLFIDHSFAQNESPNLLNFITHKGNNITQLVDDSPNNSIFTPKDNLDIKDISPIFKSNKIDLMPTSTNLVNLDNYMGPTIFINNLPLPPPLQPNNSISSNDKTTMLNTAPINNPTTPVMPTKPPGCDISTTGVNLNTLLNPGCLNYIKATAVFNSSKNGTLIPPPPSNFLSNPNAPDFSPLTSSPQVPCQVFIQPINKDPNTSNVPAIQPMLTSFNTSDLKQCIEVGVRLTYGIPSITNIIVHNDTYGVVAITCVRNQDNNNEVKCSQQPDNLQAPENLTNKPTTIPLTNTQTATQKENTVANVINNSSNNTDNFNSGIPRAIIVK